MIELSIWQAIGYAILFLFIGSFIGVMSIAFMIASIDDRD